jgi:hypothetical protein
MKFVTVLTAMVFALSVASVYTQGRGNGQAKKTSVSTPKAKSTQTAKGTTKAAKAETRIAKADTRAAKATAKAETRAAKTAAKTARKSGTTTTTTDVADTSTTTTKSGMKAGKLNTDQETRLLAQLPAGMTVQDAAAGFKNWGQFVAATNASINHSIPFDQLKTAMTGIAPGATAPTTAPMSLGQAIQSLKGTTPTPTTTATTTTTTTPVQ